jgi:Flp pilus assembly protein TadD
MLKRLAIVLCIAALVVVVSEPRSTVHSTVMTDAELAMVNEANNDDINGEKKGGNRLVKVVTFPFKAVGRLFGFGKKENPNKLERLSEKDVKKFESAKVARVTDARSIPAAPTTDGAAPAPAATDETSKLDPDQALARIYLADGRKAFNNGDANGAIAALTHAISLDKKLYDAHNLLGIAYESKGLRNNALESLKASLKGDNDQPEHLNDYGYLLMKHREFESAVKYLKRAVKAKPDERFLNNLALAQVELGKFDDAYKNFERAVGEFQGRLNIAIRLKRLGWNKKAIDHLEKARALQPESMAVLADLVVLYQRTGKLEEAAEANKTLITLRTSAEATSQP